MRKFLGTLFGKDNSFFEGQNSYRGASIILIITLFFSNVLGVIRDHFLTQKIPTDILSTYYAAFRIPDLIFNILILGAISSAFIPVFSSLLHQHQSKKAWELANSVINIAILSLVLFCLVLAFLIPYLAPLFVPGFDTEKLQLTIQLAQIMLFSPIFFGLSYIFGAILNSYKRFLVYALAPLFYNLTIILGTLFLVPIWGVKGVAWAVVLGAFLHMAIQFPVVWKLGFRWQALFQIKNPEVRKIGFLMFPRAIGLGANQILLIVFTAIASMLGGSAVAIYNLADNIQTMPVVVFGTSFAMAIFPTLAEDASKKNDSGFIQNFTKTFRSILFFLVPIVFGVILLRAQIVRMILGSGHFGWSQTIDTANTLGYFAVALVFTGLIPLFSRSFYALKNTKIPMVITCLAVIVSILIGRVLAVKMGIEGLALAYSLGSIFNASVLYFILRKKISLPEGQIVWFIFKIFLASLIMAVGLQETKFLVALFVDMTRFWGVFTQTFIAILVASFIYLILTWVFNCEEAESAKNILRRLRGRSIVQERG